MPPKIWVVLEVGGVGAVGQWHEGSQMCMGAGLLVSGVEADRHDEVAEGGVCFAADLEREIVMENGGSEIMKKFGAFIGTVIANPAPIRSGKS